MSTSSRNREYAGIRTMSELRHCKRLLKSRIEHQEVMIMYRGRSLWDFISPSNLILMGVESIASHNRTFNLFYKTASVVSQFIRSGARRK